MSKDFFDHIGDGVGCGLGVGIAVGLLGMLFGGNDEPRVDPKDLELQAARRELEMLKLQWEMEKVRKG